jgi:hypothetical protein
MSPLFLPLDVSKLPILQKLLQRKKGCDIIVAATIWPSKNTLGLIAVSKN